MKAVHAPSGGASLWKGRVGPSPFALIFRTGTMGRKSRQLLESKGSFPVLKEAGTLDEFILSLSRPGRTE